jgi:hypothetical protein
MSILSVLLTVVVLQTAGATTDRAALAGLWVREDARVTVDAEPAWQRIGIDRDVVTQVRSARPELVEADRADGTERAANRMDTENRRCRVMWEGATLIAECRATRDGGPGGLAPPIETREVHRVRTDGRLVVDLTWRSGTQEVRRTFTYRKAEER